MKQILVVEDCLADAELIQAALDEIGFSHEIILLRDGAEALDFCEAGGRFSRRPPSIPDFVLLDLKLPLVDGFGVLERMKSDTVMRFIPVVVFSGSFEEEDIIRSYSLGANGYVVKQPGTFFEHVHNVARFWCTSNASARITL